MSEVVPSVSNGQETQRNLLPRLTVKVRPYGLQLRFSRGQLHLEDTAILGKLRFGIFYDAHVWISREGE